VRIAAIVEYDGSRFSGWQSQDGERTVQGVVEQALSVIADEPIKVVTAGRTDAGVHALAQVIHFDTSATRTSYSWVRGGNSNLPGDAALLWAGEADSAFHARFSATGRHYHYVILNRTVRPTYLAGRVTHEYRPLAVEPMQRAAQFLVGTHDFTSFRAIECEAKSPVRELRALSVERRGDLVHIRAYANAFLHHMVRNLAGVLMAVGSGERPPAWAHEVLEARDRRRGGVTAPPDGLYLAAVEYPASHNFPQLSKVPGLW
jgi:tRNA pseudouridine38-40 synthase